MDRVAIAAITAIQTAKRLICILSKMEKIGF